MERNTHNSQVNIYLGIGVPGKTWALKINDEGQSITTEISFESNGQIINPLATFKKGKPQSPFKPVNFCMGLDGQMFILDWQGYIYRTI